MRHGTRPGVRLAMQMEHSRRIAAQRRDVFALVVDVRTWPSWLGGLRSDGAAGSVRRVEREGTYTINPLCSGQAGSILVTIVDMWPSQYLEARFCCPGLGEARQQWFFADIPEHSTAITVITTFREEGRGHGISGASAPTQRAAEATDGILEALARFVGRSLRDS